MNHTPTQFREIAEKIVYEISRHDAQDAVYWGEVQTVEKMLCNSFEDLVKALKNFVEKDHLIRHCRPKVCSLCMAEEVLAKAGVKS